MCCNEHLSVSPRVHVSMSVWCHSIGIHTARLRTEVYHGSVLLRGRSPVTEWLPPLCLTSAGSSNCVTIMGKTKYFTLLICTSLLLRWSVFHILLVTCISSFYVLPILIVCTFLYFISHWFIQEFFWVLLSNSVYIVLYNLRSTFHMHDIL